jgi:hypothetical protein
MKDIPISLSTRWTDDVIRSRFEMVRVDAPDAP